MKRFLKSIFACVITCLIAAGLTVTAFAAETATVTYEGGGTFSYAPENSHSSTSLFPNLENAMPGDVLTQEITVVNSSSETDYINVYLRAVPHDEDENPLATDVADTEDVASMSDFLSQLQMTVVNADGETIFEASPDQTDGLTEPVFLGALEQGESTTLTATLTVPADLGNEYANRSGEVDWEFTVEELNSNAHLSVGVEVTNTPENSSGYVEGEKVEYKITVTNDGNVPLKSIVVTDPLTGDTWTVASLAPGESVSFTTSHVVTADEAAAGSLENKVQATAVCDDPNGTQISADEAKVTVTTFVPEESASESETETETQAETTAPESTPTPGGRTLTGDSGRPLVWGGVAAAAVVVIIIALLVGRKHRQD